MKILIIEDEPLVAADLVRMLESLDYKDVFTANSTSEAKEVLDANAIDLAILDIDLGEESGVNFSKWLDVRGVCYFFLSGKQDTSIFYETMHTRAVSNIVKPISLTTLRNTILYALKTKGNTIGKQEKLFIPTSDGKILIRIDDILFIKAGRTYCDVQIKGEKRPRTLTLSLGKILEEINAPFIVRIHKSSAINVHHIQLRKGNLLVVDPMFEPLEIGGKYRKAVNQMLDSL